MTDSSLKVIAETFLIGGGYILTSACLLNFNKYLMNGRFPYAKVFTTFHMIMATLLSLLLYKFAPSLYPSMDKARANWKAVLKFMVPLGCLFAMNLYLSNKALQYCTLSFVQFCKEGNVALMFALACLIGLQAFTWYKVRILSIVMLGCALCAHGEPEFAMKGFLLQISAQVAECVKNLIGEVVMSGSGMKLDVLTFVALQAPISFVPLFIFMVQSWQPGVWAALQANWFLLILNALNAFALNVVIATSLKRMSAVAFVVIGVVKDGIIVITSAMIQGDPISTQQKVGFAVIVVGILLWGHMKIQERKTNQEQQLQQLQEQNVEDASIKETELVAIADLGEPSPTSRALANSNDSI